MATRARAGIIVFGVAVFFSKVGWADEPPAESPPPTSEPATSEQAPPPRDAVAEEARARYRRGIELFDDGDYRLALLELERAYSLSPNYKVLYNIAQVHFQLNEYAKARAAFERYLKEGGSDVPESRRAEVEKELATLKTRVAILSVNVNIADAEVTLNGEPVGKGSLSRVVVDAGVLRVQVAAQGFGMQTRVVKLAGGDETTMSIVLTKSTPDIIVSREGLPATAIAGWITTGILVAGAVGTGIAANAAASRYDTKRSAPIQGSPQEAAADLDRQRSLVQGLAVTTDVLAVAAILAGGVSLYLTLRRSPQEDAPRVSAHGKGAAFAVGF